MGKQTVRKSKKLLCPKAGTATSAPQKTSFQFLKQKILIKC